MQLAKGSWGLQIGAQQTDLVLLVMNRRGLEKLLEDKVSLGADASIAGGPVGRCPRPPTRNCTRKSCRTHVRRDCSPASTCPAAFCVRTKKRMDARTDLA
jgi:hypothetical protein